MGIGLGELVLLIAIILPALGLPIAMIVGMVVIYRKAARVEDLLEAHLAEHRAAGSAEGAGGASLG